MPHNTAAVLASLRPGSMFLALRSYRSVGTGEVADHTVCFHFSYGNALERSIRTLTQLVLSDSLEIQAREELVASYQRSLDKVRTEPLEILGDVYDRVMVDGAPVKGIKIHRETGNLHLFGLHVNKKVLVPGTYKEVKSRPLTVAKDQLRKLVPVERFRQFIVEPGQVETVNVEGMQLPF